MLGPEWGQHGYVDLIPPNDEITIFLCDIEDDNSPDGGIVGYFWAKDNFTQVPTSPLSERAGHVHHRRGDVRERLRSIGDLGLESTDYWPEEIYSTLAHEFQHMIHFYQREVLRDAMRTATPGSTRWPRRWSRTCSSDKMEVIGPRGVDGVDGTDGTARRTTNTEGRLPLFNAYNDISLRRLGRLGDALKSYSITYAFGAWLARNYGGASCSTG